jgi:crossover junction endodeoxyribonuclease RuvC
LIILGIDPGSAILGYGLIEADDEPRLIAYGAVTTQADCPMPQRLADLFDQVSTIIERHRPDVLAIEQLFFARNVTTAIAVGQARGVVLLAAARAGVTVVDYSPSEVKHAVVGYGKADKAQMQEMVRLALGLDHTPQPDDAADALAVAVCHAQRFAFETRVGRSRDATGW